MAPRFLRRTIRGDLRLVIYEFALEPELVATWHERRAGYPIWSQLGPGLPRVACSFPVSTWKRLVVDALRALFPDSESAEWQTAQKNIEVLVRHFEETGTARKGAIPHGETWLAAAQREHGQFPFGGIIVRSAPQRRTYLIEADRFGAEDFPAWTPSMPPVQRQPKELANALAPLLRSARGLHFVDPYFDASVPSFFEPMREYLAAAQQRRDPAELVVEIHFGIRREEIDQATRAKQRTVTELELAKEKIEACRNNLLPLLQPGIPLRAFAWSEKVEKPHNRYVLTNIGGVLIGTGLDSGRSAGHTDDLTVLSKDQHKTRWAQYARDSSDFRLIAHDEMKRAR